MRFKMFHQLFAMAIVAGVFAGYASAAPAQNAGTTDKAVLIDEATPAAQAEPSVDQKTGAEEPANTKTESAEAAQNSTTCEQAAPEKKGGFPVLPVVFTAIGTIAFVVLALIF